MTIALLDGDILAYRCAASCEPNSLKQEREPLELSILRLDELCHRIFSTLEVEEYRVFISGTSNFRKELFPDYKANRRGIPRPVYLDTCRDFLVREWNAEICAGCEADDGIGIAANEDSIICSVDKDLKQIPGQHYNFVKEIHDMVDEWNAVRNFYTQMLVGDSGDNIDGVRGIGVIKAARLLDGKSPQEMEDIVYSCYGDEQRYVLNHRLLRVLRSKEELQEIEDFIQKGKGAEITAASCFSHTRIFSRVDNS